MSNIDFLSKAGSERRGGNGLEGRSNPLEKFALSLQLEELAHSLSKVMSAVEQFESVGEVPPPPNFNKGIDFYDEVRRFEIVLIQRALNLTGGSQKRAALLLGLKPTTLNAKIKTYNLVWKRWEINQS
jgi:DNA-binding NtrC family response regulator